MAGEIEERPIGYHLDNALLHSIAISMKRIADNLEGSKPFDKPAPTTSMTREQIDLIEEWIDSLIAESNDNSCIHATITRRVAKNEVLEAFGLIERQ